MKMRFVALLSLFCVGNATRMVCSQEYNCFTPAEWTCTDILESCGMQSLESSASERYTYDVNGTPVAMDWEIWYQNCDGSREGIPVSMASEQSCGEDNASSQGTHFRGEAKSKVCWIRRPCSIDAFISNVIEKSYENMVKNNDGDWVWDGTYTYAYKAICDSHGGNATLLDEPQSISWIKCEPGVNCVSDGTE